MGRARLAWRLAALAAALACGFAAPASAQRGGVARDSAQIIAIGTPNAGACLEAAAAPVAEPNGIAICDAALRGERLERVQRVITLLNRGLLHMRLRHGPEALADFDAVIEIDDDNGEAYLNRGATLLLMDRPAEAIVALTEAMALGVREPHKAYFNRGQAREALGDQRGAMEDYSTALEIQPDWGPASAEMARYTRERRDLLANALDEPVP